jgi:ribosomal protein S18 acetylase RimI-like enzyme
MNSPIAVRRAEPHDVGALGRMGAALARLHHSFDADRFWLPEDVEKGYRWWLGRELRNPKAAIVVAEDDAGVLGYAYGLYAEPDWNTLRDACAELVDLWVDERGRRRGAAAMLVEEIAHVFAGRGAPRLVLMAAQTNADARRLFERAGFRPTMIEMTRELGDAQPAAGQR